MAVETVNFISDLNPAWPDGTEPKSQGDEHLRNTKKALRQNFPNFGGAVNATHVELNYMVGVTSAVQTQINTKATKAGDAYTGAHNFSGATSVALPAATTVGAVTAAEIGYLSGVTSGIQTQITAKVSKTGDTYSGAHNMTGATVTVVTQPLSDKTTKAASTKFVDDAVTAAALSMSLPGQAGNAGKYLSTDGTNAGWASAPVVSVMGRSGVVAGLVEQSIALPANTDLNTVVSSGFYRLYPTPVNAPADVGVSYGQMVVSRGSDTIVQMVFDHDKGGMALRVGYNTGLAAPVFSRWQRVLSDGNVLEKAHIQFVSGAATVNPVNGSIADIVFGANTTITVAAPRAPGDQVLLRLQPLGPYSYSFAGTNVRLPSGASLPTIAAYIQLSISLVANRDGATWDAYIGPKH